MSPGTLKDAVELYASGDFKRARDVCLQLTNSDPKAYKAYYFLALAENKLGNVQAALEASERAVAGSQSHPETLNLMGVLLVQLGKFDTAVRVFSDACRRDPNYAAAKVNLGTALLDCGRLAEAVAVLDDAARIASDDFRIVLSSAQALHRLGRHESALERFRASVRLNPRSADARTGLAETFRILGRSREAVDELTEVLRFEPANLLALQKLGSILHVRGEFDVALNHFERLASLTASNALLSEQHEYALSMAVSCRRTICAWDGMVNREEELLDRIRQGNASVPPHLSFMIADDGEIQALCAARYFGQMGRRGPAPPVRPRPDHERLRIGYISADFRDHPTSRLIAGLIEDHDRSRFQVHAFSNGPDDGSALRSRIARGFDCFTDITNIDDAKAASLIAGQEIDILVDLSGPMTGGRPGVIAMKPAPVISHFIGNPGPPGITAVDYFIADAMAAPDGSESYFGCAIARLPHSCMPIDARAERLGADFPREKAQLPPGDFVFCGFCQSTKLSPEVFDVWMRILQRTPSSVLWLLEHNRFISVRLREEAGRRGVDPQRLVFAPRLKYAEHIERHSLANLVLDTWPCGAHSSAIDALCAGTPLITKAGRTFAARLGASILTAAGLPELIVEDTASYEELAVRIANSPVEHARLKSKLNDARRFSPLWDAEGYRRSVENAYLAMWRRFRGGERPQSFEARDVLVT